MKSVLILLAAVLFFYSCHTCATSPDVQKWSLLKLTIYSNKLRGALTADNPTVSLIGTLTSTGTVTIANGNTLPANVPLSGPVTGGQFSGTFTATGTIAVANSKTLTGTVTVTVKNPSALTGAENGSLTGTVTATVTGAGGVTGTVSGTLTGKVTPTAVPTVSGGSEGVNRNSPDGSPTQTDTSNRESQPTVSKPSTDGQADSAATSTESKETTTTSTAAPTEAPQQATEKPTNPTEGKTDSSNRHVSSHVVLFIGSIALLYAVG